MTGRLGLVLIAAASSAWYPPDDDSLRAARGRSTTVGMPAQIEQLVLPGPELEVAPIEDLKTPVVIRITAVYAHGNAFRYDLTYYAIRPGTFDLVQFLRRKDRKPSVGMDPVTVVVNPVLPPGQIEPNRLERAASPSLGGYRLILVAGGMLWSAGLVLILYLTRRRPGVILAEAARPLTLADRLWPLVEKAVAGTLDEGEHAELERLLLGYWRRRLSLEDAAPAAAMAAMRRDGEAGPVIRQLEEWLHKPGGAAGVDIPALLQPYKDIPADQPALDRAPAHPLR
jgi:hypothetical protein